MKVSFFFCSYWSELKKLEMHLRRLSREQMSDFNEPLGRENICVYLVVVVCVLYLSGFIFPPFLSLSLSQD